MRTKEFEQYAKNQLMFNLAVLAVMLSCSASVLVMLRSI
jgi:hypothetical protein